ncbi:IS3 family transposase [Streptomyces lavendulae]|uniref:IS3 family transposase n=1 Tax=Streptomyces lavendulae TaxID=1914 RepID=UPI003CD0597B
MGGTGFWPFGKWLAGAETRAARRREDLGLAEKIREVHCESGGAYGSARVTAELRETGLRVNEKRVARVDAGLLGHRHPPAQTRPHHRLGPGRLTGARSVIAGLHRRRTGPEIHGGHHLSPPRERGVPLPCGRPGLLQPQGRRLVPSPTTCGPAWSPTL